MRSNHAFSPLPEYRARFMLGLTLLAGCWVSLLTACSPSDQPISTASIPSAPLSASASGPQSSQPRYSLGIVGYNYGDVGMVDYRVNGTGAFNLGVSTETAGGGSTICCAGWAPATKLPKPVVVEWTRGGDRWCRTVAALNGPVPAEPTTLEIHFYPDGHVEAAITDKYSPPRLKLKSEGGAYRIGRDVNAERRAAVEKDNLTAECQDGEFSLANDYYFQQLKKFELLQKEGKKP
jgi:hypothetical protein